MPTQQELVAPIQEKIAALQEEARLIEACGAHRRQRINEWLACLRLPVRSAEKEACYQALPKPYPACREQDERAVASYRRFKRITNACFERHPVDVVPTVENRQGWETCVDERMGWREEGTPRS